MDNGKGVLKVSERSKQLLWIEVFSVYNYFFSDSTPSTTSKQKSKSFPVSSREVLQIWLRSGGLQVDVRPTPPLEELRSRKATTTMRQTFATEASSFEISRG